jgi:phosphocarrier protein HPr
VHARPAAMFVKAAAAAQAPVRIAAGGDPVDARSILAVLSLGVGQGQEVEISAEGEHAEAALDAVEAVLVVDHDA